MARYAANTSVPVERSRVELERTLQRYDASGFGYGWDRRTERWCENCRKRAAPECDSGHKWRIRDDVREIVLVSFKVKERMVRLDVPMPTAREAGGEARQKAAERQRWRAMLLVIKAKLEAVASGISTLEHEFLANIVMQNGLTVGQAIVPRLSEAVESGRLLPPASDAR